MKKGKELKIDNYKNYNIVFGSVNNKEPKAIYINISAWCDPQTDENVSYSRVIRDINKKVKQILYNEFDRNPISEFVKDRTIVDLDIRESGIRYGKRSFMNCEVTLFLKNEILVSSEDAKPMLNEVIDLLIKSAFEHNRHFKFYKKKN